MTTLIEIKQNHQELSKHIAVLEVEKPQIESLESAKLDAQPLSRMEDFGNFDGDVEEKLFRTLVS